MARPFSGNWACKAIEGKVSNEASSSEIAEALSSAPEFLETIQTVLDNPGNPDAPGGSPVDAIISALSNKLVEPNY